MESQSVEVAETGKQNTQKVAIIGGEVNSRIAELIAEHPDVEVVNLEDFDESLIRPSTYPFLNHIDMPLTANDYEDFKYSHLTTKQRNAVIKPVRNSETSPKISRNEPCPCGSGKKYKHCCAD